MLCTVHGPGGLSVKAGPVAAGTGTKIPESRRGRRFVLMPSSFSRPLYRDGHGRVRRGPSHRPDLECQSGCDAHYMSEPCTDLYARLEAVANAAGLLGSLLPRRDVTLFCQDWGGRAGPRVVAHRPDL